MAAPVTSLGACAHRVPLPRFRHAEWFADHELLETRYLDGAASPERDVDGVRGDAPGQGSALEEKDLAGLRVAA